MAARPASDDSRFMGMASASARTAMEEMKQVPDCRRRRAMMWRKTGFSGLCF
jgi:hypothetical protein